MRYVFIVQGEGRGHLTQALALAQLLRGTGNELAAVLIGVANDRQVPDFFTQAIQAPVETFASPALAYHPKTHALSLGRTVRKALRAAPAYFRSLRQIRRALGRYQPDVIVNFYEVLAGLTQALFRPGIPMVCIAHQYLLLHPAFPHPPGWHSDRWLINLNSWLTSLGARQRLALSFTPLDGPAPRGMTIVPPLLRQEVLARRDTPYLGEMAYLLGYVSQPALSDQLVHAHRKAPFLPLRLFRSNVRETVLPVDDTLSYHRIDGQAFLDQMEGCTALVTTAGFEAVCEALYLGKPVLMVPMPGHYEQRCNARDGERAGAGVAADSFALEPLRAYLPRHTAETSRRFRQWHARGMTDLLTALEQAGLAQHHREPTEACSVDPYSTSYSVPEPEI